MIGAGVVGVVAVGAVLFLRSTPGNRWLKGQIESVVTGLMTEGSFTIGSLETDLFGHAHITDLRISDAQGQALVRVGEAEAWFDVTSLVSGRLTVKRLQGMDVDVVLDKGRERMAIAEVFGPPSESTEPFQLPLDFDVAALHVEGLALKLDDVFVFTGGVLSGAVVTDGPVWIGSDLSACVHLIQPGPLPVCAQGPLVLDSRTTSAVLSGMVVEGPGAQIAVEGVIGREVSVSLAVGDIDLQAIDPLASNVGLDGTLSGALQVQGPIWDLTASGLLAGTGDTQGSVLLSDGYWKTGAETTWGGDLKAQDLDVVQLWPQAGRPVVLDGDLSLKATGLRFPDDLVLDLAYTGDALVEDRWSIEDGDFTGTLKEGALVLSKGAFHGIAGPLNATGRIDLVKGPLGLRVTGGLDEKELAALGIEGVQGSSEVDLNVRGDLKKGDGRFGVDGSVTFAPLDYLGAHFDQLVAQVDGQVDGADWRFTVGADGSGFDAFGLEVDMVTARGLDAASRDGTITVAGPVEASPLTYPGLGTFENATAQVGLTLPKAGERRVTADATLGPYDLQTFPGDGGKLRVGMTGDSIQYALDLDAWGRDQVTSQGTYDLGTGSLRADRLLLAPTQRLAWNAEGPVTLTVVPGGVADASVTLRGLHGDIVVTGDLATQGVLDGSVDVQNFQLDVMAELFPDSFSGLSGVLDLNAVVSGPADAVVVNGTTKVHGLWVEGATRWLDVQGSFDAREGGVNTDLVVGAAGDPLATVKGRIPAVLDLQALGLDPDGLLDARVTLLPGKLERLEYVTVSELGLPQGAVSATAVLTGTLADPDLDVRGILEQPLGGWSQPARVEFEIDRHGSLLDANAVLREGLAERATLTAGGATRLGEVTEWLVRGGDQPDTSDLELWLNDMAVSVLLASVPAESLLAAADTRVPAKGELSGSILATGSPTTPRITSDLHWYRGAIAGFTVDRAQAVVKPVPEGLDLDLGIEFTHGGKGSLTGTLPVSIDLNTSSESWIEGALDLTVEAVDLPLGMLSLVDSGLSEVVGEVDLNGTVKGTFHTPDGDLTGAVRDGGFVHRELGLRFKDVQGELEGKRRRIKLTNVRMTTEPLYPIGLTDDSQRSELRLAGSANLDGLSLSELTAKLTMDRAWVMGTAAAAVRTDGAVIVSGAWPELAVNGEVDLVSGRIRYDPATFAGAGALELDRRLVVHRDGEARVAAALEPSVIEDFRIDLDLDLNRNLELVATYPIFDSLGSLTANLTRAVVTARLGGDMNVRLSKGDVLLGGEVDVVSGNAVVLRTQFGLDEGKVYFTGGPPGESQLELNGTSSIQGDEVALSVRGTVDEPDIDITSEGYDPSQVWVMLLTGRSLDSLGTDQGQAASGELGEVGAGVGQAAALLLAASVFSGTSSGALSVEADGSVKIGAPWSRTVFTQVVLNMFPDARENVLAVSLDWTLAPKVLLEVGAGERFQWTDLTWETRF